MFIESAEPKPPARFGGPEQVEWLRTSRVPARRTAPRDVDGLTINMALLPE